MRKLKCHKPLKHQNTLKRSKEPKGAKGSKEFSKVAAAQKVVKTISGDKAKTKAYCDIGELDDQIEEAEKQNDMRKIDELNSKKQELATKLGPDYVELMVDSRTSIGCERG